VVPINERMIAYALRRWRAPFSAGDQFTACVSRRFRWIFLHLQPCPKIEYVYANAKHIRWDEAILQRVQPDHTDNETIDARDNETGPHLSSDQDRCNDGEKTG
jgi:hypothetical protein